MKPGITRALLKDLRRLLRDAPGPRPNAGGWRRLTPFSRSFGFDRGQPVDRYYIEHFLLRFASDIRGRVLEIGDAGYTRKFGGEQVARSDVLDYREENKDATIIADLAHGDMIPGDSFECAILTQTLQFVYDLKAAVKTVHRILKPGGVVLATLPGISQISRYDMDREGDYWRFTTLSAQRLFDEFFAPGSVSVEACGNVLTAIAFLHGLARAELTSEELDLHDPDYQLLVTVRAVKPH